MYTYIQIYSVYTYDNIDKFILNYTHDNNNKTSGMYVKPYLYR